MIKTYSIPAETLKVLRERFEADLKTRVMNVRACKLQTQGKFREAMDVRKEIENAFDMFVASFLREQEDISEKITLKSSGVGESDAKVIVELIVTAFMAMDIIDTCVMDADSVLKRTDKRYSLTLFDEVRKFMATAKSNFRSFRNVTHYLEYALWGETVDKQGEMMRQKARSIMRRVESLERKKEKGGES